MNPEVIFPDKADTWKPCYDLLDDDLAEMTAHAPLKNSPRFYGELTCTR